MSNFLQYSLPQTIPLVDASFGTLTTNNSQTGNTLLKSACATNGNASIRYLQFYNGNSTSGTLIFSFPIPAGLSADNPGSVILDSVFFGGIRFLSGLTWAISTAPGSYNAATAADHTLNITYQ